VSAANLVPGGKSLSGDGSHSPTVRVRVSKQMHAELTALASARGTGVSKLVRQLLAAHLDEMRRS
jgi:predicted HicB family RNase H-like nuclease